MRCAQKLRKKILSLPDSCGVYLMRNSRNQVIYVGKANSLKKRLLSYLGADLDNKTASLMAKALDMEFRLCTTEAMALLLEAGLIRQLRPKYNISLKDDKSFPFVKISKEKFPSVYITRKKDNSPGDYLGPYTNAKLLKAALKIIRRSFAYRSCRRLPKQSCIYYRINLCPAPCIGKISPKEYKRIIDCIVLILEAKTDSLIRKLNKAMRDKSKAFDFEGAAGIRDQIAVLSELSSGSGGINRKSELEDLKNRLGLVNLPVRIEGFDVSNLSGKHSVGSMVSFQDGVADKNNYRRFRIKNFSGVNDYKMLGQIVYRRYRRLIKENKPLPDLVLIDGGQGHLLTAFRQLKELNLNLALVSIAKEREHIYSSQKPGILSFPKDAPGMNLIRKIRDEAHRFALGYHRLLRRKELIHV
ncbi:MAG: excinuclease ABC subunit C [Candidatus Omnitrophica bacterium CG11_big_fil_rev_8_21_14_0_20_41_12]|nr:MAG: excinuclease ABC subunit C [Candidatus Omnitrophica bacterium CG11_big_fil_rev_8_21_14_0_20_41_12]